MRAAGVPAAEITALQRSFATLGVQLLTSKSGRQTARLWLTHDDRVHQILKADPALGQRVGKAVSTLWPRDADFTATGAAASEPRLPREALVELRGILQEIARADAGPGSTGLAHVIDDNVLPRLRDGLAGRPYREALGCYLDGC